MKTISIITAHYRRPQLLRQMIESVQRQTDHDWELIVIDDQSPAKDWTEITSLATDPRIRIIRRNTGLKGPNTCRNLGLEVSIGEYVIFLDSDDILAPWCLEERRAAFAAYTHLDFLVFPVLLFRDKCGDSDLLWNDLEGNADLSRFLGSTPPWCITSPIWKRESLLGIEGLDPILRYGTDSELHTRALVRGLGYKKMTGHLPDTFIRRDDTPRFNTEITDQLLQAQIDRISAGRKLLVRYECSIELCNLWQKQCFSCLEFLIYNAPKPGKWISLLIAEWMKLPGTRHSDLMLMRAYALCGTLFRRRLYLLLRIARRIVISLRGRFLLDANGGFHSSRLDTERLSQVLKRLADS